MDRLAVRFGILLPSLRSKTASPVRCRPGGSALFAVMRPGLAGSSMAVRTFSFTARRLSAKLPESIDGKNDLLSNDLASRVPKFPLHKDLAPSLIPPADSPRVSENFTFRQLMERLRTSTTPVLLYMAESHRLYFMACFALAFVAAYNLFDMLTLVLPSAYDAYVEDKASGEASTQENVTTLVKRFGLVALMSGVYLVTSAFFVTFPSRLVRRIELDPVNRLVKLVTHPLIPGRPSPVITAPLAELSIGARTKVWTGDGFYGATSKASFFFFIWEKGHRLPWIVDRNGWFWGDARVDDVLFGKEPIAIAERGLSYDDGLKRQMLEAEKKKAELRRELGPAWQFKAQGRLMQEDLQKFSEAGRRAVLGALKKKPDQKQLGDSGDSAQPPKTGEQKDSY